MKHADKTMRSTERWLFLSGLVFGLALYQMVDIYWLRPYRDSAIRAYARSARECHAHSQQCSTDLASCEERDAEAGALQSRLNHGFAVEP